MKVLVGGAGSIGCLFGGFLHLAGHDVTLLGRGVQVEEIGKNGLTLRLPDGEQRTNPKAVESAKELSGEKFELFLLSTKAYDLYQVTRDIAPLLKPQSTIALLQNGIGVESEAQHLADGHYIVRVLTSCGACLERSGLVQLNGFGPSVVGAVQDSARSVGMRLSQELNAVGLPTRFTNSLQSAVWEKTLVNAAINPLAALLGVENGTLLMSEHTRSTMMETIREGQLVSEKLAVVLESDPAQAALTTAKMTGHNVNSMLQDLRKGGKTEIDYINGAIVRYGKQVGVPTAVNQCLTSLVKAMEITVVRQEPKNA